MKIITLHITCVSDIIKSEDDLNMTSHNIKKFITKNHENAWSITAEISYDYYVWIEKFKAIHPFFGEIDADLHEYIHCSSKEAYENFTSFFPLEIFDLGGI